MPNGLEQKGPGRQPSNSPGFLTVFPSIMLPMFLAVVDQTIVAAALPAIAASTGQFERASWIVVGYLIASTVAAPIYGRLGDSFGRRRLMLVALSVFIVTSLLCAASPSIELLTAARVLQGLGGGGLMTLSQALIGEAIPPRQRARYQGYLAAVAVCANTFGPIAGGYLTEHLGWQSIFLVNLPIGLVAMWLMARMPKTSAKPIAWRADPGGLALLVIFVTTMLLALEQAQRWDPRLLPVSGGLFAVGIVAMLLLIRHEQRTPSPLIPVALLRQPEIWRSDALAACQGAALVSLITFVPIYLEAVRGVSPSVTGLLLVPLTVGIGFGSLLTGRLVSKTGRTMIFPVVGLALATANIVFIAFFAPVLSETALGATFLFNGLFMGTVMGVVQVTVQTAAGPQRLGEAAASVQFSRTIGAAFGTALIAALLFAVLSFKNPQAAAAFATMVEHPNQVSSSLAQLGTMQADITQTFRIVFLAIAVFTAAGTVFALTNPLRRIA